MEIAILLFDRITALDAIGPYEVLSRVPEANVRFVGKRAALMRSDNGFLGLAADAELGDVTRPDVLVVPGGPGSRALESDSSVLDWIRTVHAHTRYTTGVCTGTLVLGAAGLLNGLQATTHWAWHPRLGSFGAQPTTRRVVEQGKVVTAAGVSSGIDMALTLAARMAGDAVAQAIQLGIEYDPEPPFDAGAPDKAPADVTALVRTRIEASSRQP